MRLTMVILRLTSFLQRWTLENILLWFMLYRLIPTTVHFILRGNHKLILHRLTALNCAKEPASFMGPSVFPDFI